MSEFVIDFGISIAKYRPRSTRRLQSSNINQYL